MPHSSAFANIKQVAQRAGVSPSTASRVLSGQGYSSEDVRARVEQAARELSYEPHLGARSLKLRSSRMIGLIIQDITNPFYSFIAKAIEDVTTTAGYHLALFDSEENRLRETNNLRLLLQSRVDGVIIVPTHSDGRTLRLLQQRGVAIVQIDRVIRGIKTHAVVVNNYAGAHMATTHLLDLGHRFIGVICGPQTITTGKDRRAGYEGALCERGIPVLEQHVKVGDFRRQSGYTMACELLDSTPRPTALFPTNNVTLEGVLQAVSERRLRIPDDVAVIGFDDVPWASFVSPPLSVVSQPAYTLGRLAAELLLRQLMGPTLDDNPTSIVLDPTLIIRGSCGGRPDAVREDAILVPLSSG